jgi:hypothetical protein
MMNINANINHELRAALAVILHDLAQSLATNNPRAERQTAAPAIFEDTKVDGFMPTQPAHLLNAESGKN